jgi:D-beta-D-heptose 7-phosphate kinase/D-beta-D-heptose 1-phosphate adenosyltransferase
MEELRGVIQEIERNWSSKRLMVVGDLMLDKYVWGEVGRISPEAPVPVVLATHQSHQPGGAANVAMNLSRLGAQTLIFGFTGGDENERLLAESLRSNGIDARFTLSQGFPTITKQRILGGRQQMLRLDSERLGTRPQEDYVKLTDSVIHCLPECDAIVLSDYAKGVLTPEVCQAIIGGARKFGIPVLVDPKNVDFSRYRDSTTICPNFGELSAAAHVDTSDLPTVLRAAQAMIKALGIDFLTATLGARGIALVRSSDFFLAPAVARQVFDVSGAGDTVIAVLALCLASGLKPETGVELANVAAGIVVGKVGTVPVERFELLAALAPEIALHAEDKVMTRQELLSRVALWKANGERVVLTNGCFDLLHVGHITILENARRFGERLIVAINSDESVRGLKGPSRPIVGERERARVLAALAAVDAVVVFDEATPLDLIVASRPDVLVKGGDYAPETIVGANEVLSWGGQIKIVPLVEGYSTSNLIAQGAASSDGS